MDAPANTISGGVKNDIYRNRLFCYRNSSAVLGVFIMKIGDRCFVHGYIDEIRKDTIIVRNDGGYFGTIPSEVITGELPSAQPERIKGHWVEILSSNHTYKCSVCGRLLVNITDGKNNVAKNYPYCHCGADMRGKQDE